MPLHGMTSGFGLLLALTASAPGDPEWTPAERAYLDRTTYVRVCADPADQPFDFIDADGRHRGIAADLLSEIGRMMGVSMRLVPSADWAETMERARRGECDVVAMLNETSARAEFLGFTRSYVTFDNAIVTHRPAYHRGLASLAGRTLALPHGYRLIELIDSDYPDIEVIPVDDVEAALRAVSRGDAYATLVNQQRLIKDIQRLRLRNVHYAGSADLADHYRIGVRRDDAMLLTIVDKALAHVAPAEVSRIMERWYVVPVESTIDWRLVLTVAGVAVTLLAFLMLHVYHRARYYRLLDRQNRELEHLSGTDPLTQTPNRRRLEARLREEIERATRHNRPLAAIMFDLDRFKQVNDQYGHQVGDDVLVELTRLAAKQQRLIDVLGRWGGEEFLVICSESGIDHACVLAERLRHAVAAHTFAAGIRLTISLGVAELQEGDTRDSLLQRVDEALYRVKAAGGNGVEAGLMHAASRLS